MPFVVTDERLEKALSLIANSDTEIANAKAQVLRTEYLGKCSESLAYQAMDKNLSVEDRKRAVPIAQGVQEQWEKHWQAVVHYEALKAKREFNYQVIELYRTASANQRRGNI